MHKTIIAIVGASLLILGLAACSPAMKSQAGTTPPPAAAATTGPKTPPTVAVGQAISYQSKEGSGTVTILSSKWVAQAPSSSILGPPKHGACLVVDVQWSGTGSYNMIGLQFRSSSGTYDATSMGCAGFDPALNSGDLAGQSVRGLVAFDAPDSAGLLDVTPAVFGRVAGAWTIPA